VSLEFEIPGQPRGKGRPRFANGHAYTDQATREYEDFVCFCTRQAMQFEDDDFPWNCPIGLDLMFYMHRPNHPRFPLPAVRPDLDNLVKSVVDGMQLAQLFTDDARIVELQTGKVYADAPGVIVRVWKL